MDKRQEDISSNGTEKDFSQPELSLFVDLLEYFTKNQIAGWLLFALLRVPTHRGRRGIDPYSMMTTVNTGFNIK